MLQGLYKVEFNTVHGSRCGVIYAYDGKMLGGNSAFAFIGRYDESGEEIRAEVSTVRHHEDPNYQPLFKTDKITLKLRGWREDDHFYFEGGSTQMPGIPFKSLMTPISDEAAPPVTPTQARGIGNGLYSIHIQMLDGVDGGNTGVMVLRDGLIRGGDGFFDYIGSYTCANGKWKGEIVNHEHTPSKGERPVFGGHEVGIGFSGTYSSSGAEAEATALAGKRSIRFKAVLKKLAEG
ncbi:GrlR family regulatory protein [uncultured Bradyrhizobium sp.]|uniref:GrlR family regulatory protein n=1 Tax=uncultured Bradyrhizobium sp. TaxID=199684 RepID=UPI0035CC5360